MRKFATALTVLAALGGLALMSTEASAQRVGRAGPGMGAFRGGGMAFRGGPGFRGGFVGPRAGWRGPGWGWGAGAAAVGLGLGLAAAGAYPYYYGDPGYYGYPAYAYGGCYLVRQWTPYGPQLVRVCQ